MNFKSNVMNINFKNAVAYLTFKEFEKYKFINHAYSTRLGGVSTDYFKSLNLGFATADSQENIDKNYDIFFDCMGVKKEDTAITSQIHENKIKCVSRKDLKKDDLTKFEKIDGLITNEPGISLMTFHADCLAVYLIDIKNHVVGLAHAGWRGTVKRIAVKLAEVCIDFYNSSKEDMIFALGPSIGPCCFEASQEILPYFQNLGFNYKCNEEGKFNVDLKEINRKLLMDFGISESNIISSDICTMCYKDLLFSHRATKGRRGTNCAFIKLV